MTTAIQTLATLLTVDNILLDVEATSKPEIFARVDRLLSSNPEFGARTWQQSLQSREQLGSTAVGLGVAIPHARMRGLDRPVAVFVRVRSAIAFDAPDGKPVTNIVAIFVPEHATQAHLQLLAGIAELFQDTRFRAALARCADADSVVALIRDWAAHA